MNGRHHDDLHDTMFQDPTEQFVHQHAYQDGPRLLANGGVAAFAQERTKLDESVDSAVSMSTTESHEGGGSQEERRQSDESAHGVSAPNAHPPSQATDNAPHTGPPNGLPLFQPPTPLPKSPEAHRRPAPFANGISSQSPELKQKESRVSNVFGGGENFAEPRTEDVEAMPIEGVDDEESLRLAKELQQEGFGLSRRSKS